MNISLLSTLTRTGGTAVVLSLTLLFQGCDEPAPPTPPTETPRKEEAAPEPKPATPRAVLGTATTEWEGIEARLIRAERTGATVQVEIELANTSASEVKLENYSAEQAILTDEATKTAVEPFAAGGPPVATRGLTTTILPGQTAVVSATFPYPTNAQKVTIEFPKINTFTGIGVEKARSTGAPASKNSADNAKS